MEFDNGRLDFAARIDTSQLKADAQKSKDILKGIGSTAVQEGNQIEAAMGKIGRSVAAVFAVSKLKDFATQVATVRGEFQQLEIAFQTMLGSKTEADSLMSQLIQTAATTPFGMSDVANSAKQLLAYGVAADEVNDTLIRLGDIAAGLSIPINDLAYLYGTTMVQGRLYTQDLNQFLGRGIPLSEELAKQFGVTTAEVKDLVTAGKVGFPEVKEAIISLTSEGGKFGGLMAAQSKTITGQMSNIEDSIEQMFNELGKSSEGIIGTTLDVVSSVVEHWKEIGKVLLVVISAYGTYKAAVIAVNAIQKINNTLTAHAAIQMKLVAMQGHALSNAQAMAAARTALLTNAWNGLKVAMAANPVGAVLAVFAAAATAIGLFVSKTTELTTMSEKFGESAAKQIVRLNTLTTTYKGLTEGTATHKKTLEELNKILEEYGIAQIKEGDNIDVVNAKREQAIELIKQEAIERQRANMIDTALEDYFKGLEAAQKNLTENLQDVAADKGFTGLRGVIDVRNKAEAISNIIAQHIQENISLIAGKTGEEYEKGLNKIYSGLEEKLKKANVADASGVRDWVSGFWSSNIVQGYIDDLAELNDAKDRSIDTTNRYADAEKKAAQSSTTFNDKVAATQRSLKGASNDVHTLYKNIKNLMSKYKQNTIGFTIDFDAKIPSWMTKMKLPRLQDLAAQFTALGDQLLKSKQKGMKVNGKYMTTQQIVQRGVDYANAAEQKQTEADEAKKQKEAEAKDKKSKDDSAAKRQKEEEKRLKEQAAERKKAMEKYAESVKEQNKQAELDIAQQQLENMEDGYEKQLKQVGLHYDRLKAENEKRAKEMIDALADNKTNEWMNSNPKASKEEREAYRKSLTDEKNPNALTAADLTAEQQKQLKAYEKIIEKIKAKEMEAIYANGTQGMLDYLKKYGSFQEQKYAIAAEYAEKIKKVMSSSDTDEQKAWQIKGLQREQKEQEQAVEANALMQQIDWYQVFGSVGSVMSNALKPLLEKLESYVKTDKFQNLGADQQKQIVDAMANIRSQIGDTASIGWRDLASDINEYQQAMKEASAATKEYNQKQAELAPAIAEAQEKLENAQKGGNETEIEAAAKELNTILAPLSESGEKVANANKRVTTSGQKLANTTKGMMEPIDEIHNFLQSAGLSELQSLWDGFNQIKSAINGIKGIAEASKDAKDVGDNLKDAGTAAADTAADAAKEAGDALATGLSSAGFIGQIIAAVLKILDVLKDGIGTLISSLIDTIFSAISGILRNLLTGEFLQQIFQSLYGGLADVVSSLSFGALSGDWYSGSNAKEVAETTERLTTQNEALQHSIDKLKDSIDDNYGGKALSEYIEARKAQQSLNENLQTILDVQMGYHGSHHSNSHYWGISDEYTQMVNELLGTALRGNSWGDWSDLTAEQMEKIRTYLPQVWTEMLDQGKYDKSEYFEKYADEAGKLQDLTDQIRENLMGTSFESLRDSFIDSLSDMSVSAEDFAEDFTETMQNALLRATISDKFDKQLQNWYERITKDMGAEDGVYKELTEAQLESYRQEWDNMANQMIAERDRIAQITGYTGDTDDREASSKGIASASQESIDELNGRMTAIQGHTYNLNENTKLLVQTSNLILRSVQNIDKNTEDIPQRLSSMESNIKNVRDTVNDIALKGIKIKA